MKNEVQGIASEEIEEQLRRIQSSPLFSHSRRYPGFLDFVVRKTLEGREEELKERTIGIEAFGRASTYDLNADPIVRVTAGEVRKRLAQYYYGDDHKTELRIELRPGSYVPDFRLPPRPDTQAPVAEIPSTRALEPAPLVLPQAPVLLAPPAVAPQQAGTLRWKVVALCLGIALVLALVGDVLPLLRRTTATDSFWSPVVDAHAPILMSVGSVVAMVNGNAVAPPANTVSGHPLSSDPIAVSDATALSSIQQVLSARTHSTISLQASTSTTFSDLQHGPVVLISGFNNPWTMRLTDALRFHLVRVSTDDYAIMDRKNPASRRWVINTATPFDKIGHDYGLVARFHDPVTEQIVVVAAGIGEEGTVAASRLLTDERYLSELKRGGAFPHPDQDFECIVETTMIDGKPGPPRIVDTYIW